MKDNFEPSILTEEIDLNDLIGKKIATFGTFDFLHKGHINLIEKIIKITGDEKNVVIGVATDFWNSKKGKETRFNQAERLDKVKIKFPKAKVIYEEIIDSIEEFWSMIWDKYDLDYIVMGGDHFGILDYIMKKKTNLGNEMKIIYLERTPDISSTELRKKS